MNFDYNKFTRIFRKSIKGMKADEVASITGVNRTVIYGLMSADKASPNRDNFAKICKWLDQPMESFFTQSK